MRGGGVKKEWKSWEDQVALLKGRHLALDEGEALGLLRTASYYRLSGYARYFQQGAELGGNDFVAGSTLADIKMIHELDGRLRTMLASRLGRVEVMLRSQYAYAVGATMIGTGTCPSGPQSKSFPSRTGLEGGVMVDDDDTKASSESFPSRTSETGARTMRDCGITPSSMPGPPRTMCARRPSAGSGISMDVP